MLKIFTEIQKNLGINVDAQITQERIVEFTLIFLIFSIISIGFAESPSDLIQSVSLSFLLFVYAMILNYNRIEDEEENGD